MLDRVDLAFFGVVQANTNDTLDKVQEVEAPKLSAHQDAIYLNPKLFARVQTLYANAPELKLTPEQRQLLDVYHANFIHAGAQLNAADKTKLRALNTRLSTLETASSRSCSPPPRPARFGGRRQGEARRARRRRDRRRRQGCRGAQA